MKINIKYILLSFFTVLTFTSCSDWLNVTSKDKVLEDQQFSTEQNINSATNGLYREMISANLYGGQLTQTTIEAMGHFYTYPLTEPSAGNLSVPIYMLGNFRYTHDAVKGNFSTIWGKAYALLLHINNYIKNVENSPAIISDTHRKTLLGEAYGLRAYIHFDLFRMYGPVYKFKTDDKILPYNNSADVTLNHSDYEETEYSSADEFIQLLLKDIATAEPLLKENDPIVTDPAGCITDALLNESFYQNRNRRMNYYALKGLEARVLQYIGEDEKAAETAKVITDQLGGVFNWVIPSSVLSNNNYVFFPEVIFGVNNMAMTSQGNTWYGGTILASSFLVDYNNLLKNILGYDGNELSGMLDVRSKQWMESNALPDAVYGYSPEGTYRSRKYFSTSLNVPAANDFQVLIRMSEMFYIQAETALKAGDKQKAIGLLNTVLRNRALTSQYFLTSEQSETEIQAHIEKEYYREFFGEGQVFFFHKRRVSSQMFKGNNSGSVAVSPDNYVVPLPETETNI